MGIDDSVFLSVLNGGENVLALLLYFSLAFFCSSAGILDLLLAEFDIILLKIPLLEWGCVNLDN